MSKYIPLGTGLAVLFIVIAASISITMKISMSVYNNLISDLTSRTAMYDNLAEIDDLVREDFFGNIESESINSGIADGYIK